jgi:4-hydroxy-2-oxoheptanedioate aldolase
MKHTAKILTSLLFITNKTARNKGHNIHTNKIHQPALKYNTLFGHYQTIIVLQIEGVDEIANIESIASVEGVDVLFAGQYDLSQSLGVPGEIDNPEVKQGMFKLMETCKRYGKWPGTFASDVERAKSWLAAGMKYLAYSVDTGILYESLHRIAELIKS